METLDKEDQHASFYEQVLTNGDSLELRLSHLIQSKEEEEF